ncbi:STAS domain-containing protein [Paenisporosarcina indica]|uniref:STAS domain-containing protein n=1 Tax=Paenisporosarcina indica TaxID=650093 RepID=UPI00094FF92C|nr:STAS domain-containing protein [Paenisporosarcina indica]
MSLFLSFSEYISKHVESLAIEVVEGVIGNMKLDIPEIEKEQAISMYVELLNFLGESMVGEGTDPVPDTVIEWSKKNAKMQVSSSGEISEILVRYPPTRDVFTDILTRISIELALSVKENALIIKRMNILMDVSLTETVYAFEHLLNEAREDTQKQLAALSAPIIPVRGDIVILPLIGDIDCYRTKYLMEQVVPKIATMDIDHVIVDFSGLFIIDEDIATQLLQLGNMLNLMGIHILITGVRPDLAQTVVNSGIDFSDIETFADVKTALKSLE